ncbi:MAG: DUF134 domain-containing protein [Bacteroidales bacterium]|jgi:predicted DNA-binding protein (UPF0251 family)|nr:DUF134 domain-containing protein [Bacteroidales bacterium]MDD3273751.1 DUF134 domain-containing protein [Bacteroidales bacterium]MDD4058494.1 DUF134 domain-containing protein [Bacteroidales bacterium]
MPRPKLKRKMLNPPKFKGYRAIGTSGEEHAVVLNLEEYESIRLSDHLLLGQVTAAQEMGVSRSTFARIYESARRKIALAFIEARPIVFEGGKVYFDSSWYECRFCRCLFNHPDKQLPVKECSLCGSNKIKIYNEDSNHINR